MQQVLGTAAASDSAVLSAALTAFAACGAPGMVVNLLQPLFDQQAALDPATAAVAVEAVVQQHAWHLAAPLVRSFLAGCADRGGVGGPEVERVRHLVVAAAVEGAWGVVREVLQVRWGALGERNRHSL